MMRLAALFYLSAAAASADIRLSLQDGDPYDRLIILNDGCPLGIAELTLDFTGSQGKVILDTVRGGPGTKDPMPVEVERGRLSISPVADGAQTLTVGIGGMGTGERASVTMDMDDTQGWWPGPRVVADGEDLSGTSATLLTRGTMAFTEFSGGGAVLTSPVTSCAETQKAPELLTVPMS